MKYILLYYGNQRLPGKLKVDILSLSLSKIVIKNCHYWDNDINLRIGRIIIAIDFKLASFSPISGLILHGIEARIKELAWLKEKNTNINLSKVKKVFIDDFILDLRNVRTTFITPTSQSYIHFDLKVRPLKAKLENIFIYDFNGRIGPFLFEDVTVKKLQQNKYLINIDKLKWRKFNLRELSIPFEIEHNFNLSFIIKHNLLGDGAIAGRIIFLKPRNKIRITLKLSKVSLNELFDLFYPKKDISIKGSFYGDITLAFENGIVDQILLNLKGNDGKIEIKNERTLNFLKNYLDPIKYKILIDSLREYQYNKAMVSAKRKDKALVIILNFDSLKRGKRKITVYYHNFFRRER